MPSFKKDNRGSGWKEYSSKDISETIANRDVYENQQLGRSRLEKVKSRRPSQILAVSVGILLTFLTWVLWSLIQYMAHTLSTMASSTKRVHDVTPNYFTEYSLAKLGLSLFVGLAVGGIAWAALMKQHSGQAKMTDTADINQRENDQHIMYPEEMFSTFDFVADVGAHTSVSTSSIIGHAMLNDKGLKKVEVARRATKDIYEGEGADKSLVYYKGDILRDENGLAITDTLPIIDKKFGDELYTASGIDEEKESIRLYYDAHKIPYTQKKLNKKDKDGKDVKDKEGNKISYTPSLAEWIEKDWEFPEYEPQRPAGVYIVDTAPVNTMILAITRAGKGQTVIEPTLDIWMREKVGQNMVVNDPKGELLVKNYIRATFRGFQVVQFNLINPMKTDIYNPLGLAADMAREGDAFKCAQYIEDIAEVFFPVDGGEDPVWATSANNAFKRSAYGLIDFYLEEERKLRNHAALTNMDAAVLETKLDKMWGYVTLYNCYQLFVQMSAKKLKDPVALAEEKLKKQGIDTDDPIYEQEIADAETRQFLWDGAEEMSMLDLYFSASEALPINAIRTLVSNTHNSLKAMSGSDKMLASVYGIAITAMSFFTDPTISTLTSGRPSQNTDLGGLSFPRRMGVRFDANYMKRNNFMGLQVQWEAFNDSMFTENLGEDFTHEDTITTQGWAAYVFMGKFPTDVGYLRMRVVNPQTHMLSKEMYFKFTKAYQTSLNGRTFVTDPVTGEKIIKNGVLEELLPVYGDNDEIIAYELGNTMFKQELLEDITSGSPKKVMGETKAIMATSMHYAEKPKMVFLVTPPHLMKYAKLILILIRQLVNFNFGSSYLTKESQKPLFKTRFMLDEVGNLQSEGKGIGNLDTMLSIGLG